MRTALPISFAFALMLACGSSAGQGIWLEGPVDCGIWVKARKEDRAPLLEQSLTWLINGLAIGRRIDIWHAQGIEMSREQAYLWMDKYCQSDPLSNIFDGAKALANEKTKGAFDRIR